MGLSSIKKESTDSSVDRAQVNKKDHARGKFQAFNAKKEASALRPSFAKTEVIPAQQGHVMNKVQALNFNNEEMEMSIKATGVRKLPVVYPAAAFLTDKCATFVLGPLMGTLIYLFLAFLLLPDLVPDDSLIFAANPKLKYAVKIMCPNTTKCSNEADNQIQEQSDELKRSLGVNSTFLDDEIEDGVVNSASKYMEMSSIWSYGYVRHGVGAFAGLTSGIVLTSTGYVSIKTRAVLVLLLPTLVTRRGRAFMLTTAFAILMAGPVSTVEENVQRSIDGLTCLYEQTEMIARQYRDNTDQVLGQMQQIMELYEDAINSFVEAQQKLAVAAASSTDRELRAASEKVKRDVERLEAFSEKIAGLLKGAKTVCDGFFTGVSYMTFGLVEESKCFEPPGMESSPPVVDSTITVKAEETMQKTMDTLSLQALNLNIGSLPDIDSSMSIDDIKRRLKFILKHTFGVVKVVVQYASKTVYLSIIFLIADSISYLYRYITDISSDNVYADDNLKAFCIQKGEKDFLPLRRWEIKNRYQKAFSFRLSRNEVQHIVELSVLTLLFTGWVAFAVAGDMIFFYTLKTFRKEAKYGISFAGKNHSIDIPAQTKLVPGTSVEIKIVGFDLSTDPCLPVPVKTGHSVLAVIGGLILASLVSCVLDVYASRLRQTICSIFFPERAAQRASYLYKRLKSGRAARKFGIHMLVWQYVDTKKRKFEFWENWRRFLWLRCLCLIACCIHMPRAPKDDRNRKCPGCDENFVKYKGTSVQVSRLGVECKVAICSDCKKDL